MAGKGRHERTLLDVVVCKCTPVLQLLARKDQTLLVRWDPCTLTLRVEHDHRRLHLLQT